MATATRRKTTSVTQTTTVKHNPIPELNQDIIALQKGMVICVDDSQDNRIPVATVQAHLMQYKYMLSEQAFMAMSRMDLSMIESFHNSAIRYLKEMMGGEGFTPLYKNFPAEVMSKSDYSLYTIALLHYWSDGTWEPPIDQRFNKDIKFENVKYNILRLGEMEDFLGIFTDLVSVNTSITPADMKVIKWFVASGLPLKMPDRIPFKENLMTLAAMGLDVPIKTPTDVLRIAVHLSGGNISLPAVPKKRKITSRALNSYRYKLATDKEEERKKFEFKKFKRKERRYLLGLLEKTGALPAEMVLKDQRWVRLGEILHPGEYEKEFPKTFESFRKIRNEKVQSWYGKLNDAFKKDFTTGLKVLGERPGEFVRRVDWLVRKNLNNPSNMTSIVLAFHQACIKSSNKVLFELYTHLENRLVAKTDRSVFIKGARKKTPLPTLPVLPAAVVENLHSTIFSALKTKFEALPRLGNCWIDEELKKIPLPTNMRTLNDSLKPTIRGQRVPFDNPDCKVIRPFIHWQGPVDLDLSGTFVRDKRNGQAGLTGYHGTLSFSNLRLLNSCHSGDVRHRSGPCAEYLDIDIQNALQNGYKYVVLDIRNFDGGSLKAHKTRFGLMERQYPESNTTWLPETVTNCQLLEASGASTTIAMLDLDKKEYIMLDLDLKGRTAAGNSTELIKLVYEYCEPPKVSVYDLVLMHVEARGRQVNLDNNVDTYFKKEDFMNSYVETCKLMGV